MRRHLRGRARRRRGSSPTRSPRRPRRTPASAASSPRSPRAITSSSRSRSSRTRLREAGASLEDVEAVAVTVGPGPDRRPAGRGQHGEGDRRAAPPAADPGRPPAGPRRRQLPRARAARAALPLPDRERRPHDAGRGPRPRRPRGPRAHPRRRRRRGLRQGRPPARARLPGRPGARTAGRRTATPRPSSCRSR